jgi:hypothetical protein
VGLGAKQQFCGESAVLTGYTRNQRNTPGHGSAIQKEKNNEKLSLV